MQELKNDTFKNESIQNGDNSNYRVNRVYTRRFIECLRCGKEIKNDLTVIKNHEYYCKNKEDALKEDEIAEQASENDYPDEEYTEDLQVPEKAIVEPVSDDETYDDSESFSNIVLIGIAVGIIGTIIIVYKMLARKKQSAPTTTQTVISEQKSSVQPPRLTPTLPYLPY
jgi:hypothetical protein